MKRSPWLPYRSLLTKAKKKNRNVTAKTKTKKKKTLFRPKPRNSVKIILPLSETNAFAKYRVYF